MRAVTLDASVIVKWFHPTHQEADLPRAMAIQDAYAAGDLTLFQPPHWRAEVAAVLVRLSGSRSNRDVADLCLLDVDTVGTPDTYVRAADLASRLSCHLFDTLYHAAALHVPDCVLVTADAKYLRKARGVGRIVPLADWRL